MPMPIIWQQLGKHVRGRWVAGRVAQLEVLDTAHSLPLEEGGPVELFLTAEDAAAVAAFLTKAE